jgi:very-short-patch-repair endonuclease
MEELGGKGRRGAGILRELLEHRGDTRPTESPLETRLARLLRRARLPRPVAQYEVVRDGAFVARLDFAYPELRVGIEVDGYRYHSSRSAWQRDIERANALARLDWKLLRFTSDDLAGRTKQVVREIRTTLAEAETGLAS